MDNNKPQLTVIVDNVRNGVFSEIIKPVAESPQELNEIIKKLKNNDNVYEELEILIKMSARTRKFCEKVVSFFTEYYPSTSDNYENAIHEILDIAMVGYLKAHSFRDVQKQSSHFMAYGVMAASNIHVRYKVMQQRGDNEVVWDAWKDGDLKTWMQWGGEPLQFHASKDSSIETLQATRYMIQKIFLSFRDVQNIYKAGIHFEKMEDF